MALTVCVTPTDPAVQYGSYADFSFTNGLISKTLQSSINTVRAGKICQEVGLLPFMQYITFSWVSPQIYPLCSFGINACNSLKWDIVCSIALIVCQVTCRLLSMTPFFIPLDSQCIV